MIRAIVLFAFLAFVPTIAHAYFEDYPPFKFGQKQPAGIKTKLLVDNDHGDYKSKDGRVVARLVEKDSNSFDFLLKVDGAVLQENKERRTPLAYAVYEGDLDKNDINDYIIFSSDRGCGLASQVSVVDLYLRKANGGYDHINYETFDTGVEDFVDLDKDGKSEVLIMDMYGGKKHNYFVYSIYKIKDGKFINANNQFKGFPKFIWYTENKNDKDTNHLTKKERADFIKQMDSKIKHSTVTK